LLKHFTRLNFLEVNPLLIRSGHHPYIVFNIKIIRKANLTQLSDKHTISMLDNIPNSQLAGIPANILRLISSVIDQGIRQSTRATHFTRPEN